MVFDFRRVPQIELGVGAAGLALLVVMAVFPWYGIRAEGVLGDQGLPRNVEDNVNAFQAFGLVDIVILGTIVIAVLLPIWRSVTPAVGARVPVPAIATALGVLTVVLVAANLVDPPDVVAVSSADVGELRVSDFPGAEVMRKIGVWLGLTAAVLILATGAVATARTGRPSAD